MLLFKVMARLTSLPNTLILHQIPEIVTTMLACTRIGAPHR